jgi:dihydroxyacetone synthase
MVSENVKVNGAFATNGVKIFNKTSATSLTKRLADDHDLVLKTFRLLISDLCQQFNGGHPG